MGGLIRCGGALLLTAFIAQFYVQGDAGNESSCTNSDGEAIPHGEDFIPDFNDPCTICVCDKRYTISCRTTACSPPPGCKQTVPVPRKCCQFICEGNNSLPPFNNNNNNTLDGEPTSEEDNITNLSLRLVASTVTSFLVLALLLFMVHRLRQRRLMLAMRRFEAHARQQRGEEDEADHYIPAAFLHIECPPYEDPPPPYSPPKPPHILPQDSPPPYRELDNDTASLDANANVPNNNNNNDVPCTAQAQHRPDNDHSLPAGNPAHPDRRETSHTSCSNNQGGSDALSAGSEAGMRNVIQDRENDTEARLIPGVREHCPFERGGVAFLQDYSLFSSSAGAARSEGGSSACGPAVQRGLSGGEGGSGLHHPRQRNGDSNTGGGSRRGTRRAGRSCSFSLTRSPDEDMTMSGIALGPMSQSYHATTADSGVQTHGSYTASLSRHRARAANAEAAAGGSNPRQSVQEEAEGSGVCEQRMVTKPMVKCDTATQQNHRHLQEELRRNLPPAFVGTGQQQASGSGNPGNTSPGSVAVPGGRLGDVPAKVSPDAGSGKPPVSAGMCAAIPRSQSITSTFSVCSETGELHMKKGAGGGDGLVLHSDSQYPHHTSSSSSSPPHPPLAANQLLDLENPSSLPDYSFPTSAALFPASGNPQGVGGQVAQAKAGLTAGSRRPVPAPPSQELRTSASVPTSRSHSAKPKHKKIHFVPLEKSKAFKSKKDKSKPGKKGEAEQHTLNSAHHHDNGARTISSSNPHSGAGEEGGAPRMHQPKMADVVRGRLPASAPSVKQYGFLDHFPPASLPQDVPAEASLRTQADVGKDWRGGTSGAGRPGSNPNPNPNPCHSLPHKAHGSSAHHAAGHRRLFSHGDRPSPHVTVSTSSRSKAKGRPLSSGLVVEPGRDPADPSAALPQNSVPRRRAKTLHLKKARQSYPALDGGGGVVGGDRKVNSGVDLGLAEPSQESGRTVLWPDGGGGGGEVAVACTLPSKRRALDRGGDKPGFVVGSAGAVGVGVGVGVEGHMSSYV